ncbi:uncharacterized protein LOC133338054, partial [Musca vetustissima]|uniref:uncharacterized protein LOC133338054 n=1 Tax=Musca vetustissima TaxID=27455 RepID=UPI002AB7888D
KLYHIRHQEEEQQQFKEPLLSQPPELLQISLENNATPFVDFPQVATLAPHQQQQQQQMTHHTKLHNQPDLQLSRNLSSTYESFVEPPQSGISSCLEKVNGNTHSKDHSHLPAMMWQVLILCVVHLSLTTIATLYGHVKTALSQTAQQIARAVIAATTLPIIQRRQKQQQQQKHETLSASESVTPWPRPPLPAGLSQTEQSAAASSSPAIAVNGEAVASGGGSTTTSSSIVTQNNAIHEKIFHGKFPRPRKNLMELKLHTQQEQRHYQQQLSLPLLTEHPQHYQVDTNNNFITCTTSNICNAGSNCSSSINTTTTVAATNTTTTTSILTLWQHCHRRYRPLQLLPLLTTKGLNKYSWIFLLIYLNLSAK